MKQSEHGRLIFEAAKAHLRPIGCRRQGRSRFWYSDQGFWLIGVEFQPSGFDRGTYLNVGASWLWDGESYFSYDIGVDGTGHFDRFQTADQFTPIVARKAALAATHVVELRRRFRSIDAIAADLESNARDNCGWALLHAAIAAGLAGRPVIAQELFARLAVHPVEFEWEINRRQISLELASHLGDISSFRLAILERVRTARALQKLPPLSECGSLHEFARLLFA